MAMRENEGKAAKTYGKIGSGIAQDPPKKWQGDGKGIFSQINEILATR
jgi:hypothetical protein